eukprot:Plantae.Rhodophyta-Purpureofilum_apyrenoidigerum.ctg6105.p1 GENE.Plantae.Rhodophyta-Purpureofilum_apyrenoidigerum.ctg6105~~Plantae.Rhodophyta-Purpureofilum_apyrenoidigerum.ctg6105.p1  ORF type:complete len:678 (-),score=235.79 Plantae.Rhodophyta-Purpureofilum_apyrenoidigerum.ctg6105:388-2169(-)
MTDEKQMLSERVKNLQRELADAQNINKKSSTIAEELERLNAQLAEKDEAVEKARKEVDAVAAEKKENDSAAAKELSKLNAHLAKKDRDFEKARKEVDALVVEKEKNGSTAAEELERLSVQLAEKDKEVEKARKEVDAVTAEKKKHMDLFAEEKERILEDNATKLRSMQKLMSQKENDAAFRLQRINTLERQMNESVEANDRALDRANSELSAMEDALRLAEEEVTKLFADLERKDGYAGEAIFAAEVRAERAEEELAKLKEEHDASLITWIKKYRDLEMKFESEEEDKAEAVEKAVQLQETLAEVQSELDVARAVDGEWGVAGSTSRPIDDHDKQTSQNVRSKGRRRSGKRSNDRVEERSENDQRDLVSNMFLERPELTESVECMATLMKVDVLIEERNNLRNVLDVIEQDLQDHGLDQGAKLSQSVLDEVTENVDAQARSLTTQLKKAQVMLNKICEEPIDVLEELKEEIAIKTEEIEAGLEKAEATYRAVTKKQEVKEESLRDVLDTADLESRAQEVDNSLISLELANKKVLPSKQPVTRKSPRRKNSIKANEAESTGKRGSKTDKDSKSNPEEELGEKPKKKRGRPRKQP